MNKNKRNGGGNQVAARQGARKEPKSSKQEKKTKKQKLAGEKSINDQVLNKKIFYFVRLSMCHIKATFFP